MKWICTSILGVAVAVSPAVAKSGIFFTAKGALQPWACAQASQEPDPDKPKPPEKPKPKPMPPGQEPPSAPAPKPQTPEEKKPQHPQQERKQTKEDKKGIKIPPQRFQAKFGSQHTFRVQQLQNNRRFQSGGYWFEIVEVWPAGWGFNDLCYIDEDGDNYYLVDTLHPGYQLLVIVVEG